MNKSYKPTCQLILFYSTKSSTHLLTRPLRIRLNHGQSTAFHLEKDLEVRGVSEEDESLINSLIFEMAHELNIMGLVEYIRKDRPISVGFDSRTLIVNPVGTEVKFWDQLTATGPIVLTIKGLQVNKPRISPIITVNTLHMDYF